MGAGRVPGRFSKIPEAILEPSFFIFGLFPATFFIFFGYDFFDDFRKAPGLPFGCFFDDFWVPIFNTFSCFFLNPQKREIR